MAAVLPDGLDPLLERLETLKMTGVVVATRAAVQKRIVVQNGDIVFVASDDPRELIGQALLKQGLITEKDLTDALAVSRRGAETGPGPQLAAVLTAMRKVTPEQCAAVFQGKIMESVLDVFLWDSGTVEFVEGGVDRVPFPLLLRIAEIRDTGAKRRARWEIVRSFLPHPQIGFTLMGNWPAGFPNTAGDARLAALLAKGMTLEKILMELRGQDYAVSVRLAQLVQNGTLKTTASTMRGFSPIEIEVDLDGLATDPTKPPAGGVSEVPSGTFTKVGRLPMPKAVADPRKDGAPLMGDAPWSSDEVPKAVAAPQAPLSGGVPGGQMDSTVLRELAGARLAEGKIEDAQVLLMELIANDPLAAGDAWEMLQQVEAAIVVQARAIGLTDEIMLRLARPAAELTGTMFAASESFILSRFASGPMTVGSLIAISPFAQHEVLQILEKLVRAKTLARVI